MLCQHLSQTENPDLNLQRRNHHMMKYVFAILLLTGTLRTEQDSANQVTAKPWEEILGAWKQVPGPDDPSMLKIETEGGGIKLSFGCKQDGSCLDIIIGNYDGKLHKDAGSPTWEASFRKTGDRTMQEEGYSSGKPSTTVAWQLSPDGKTLTRTIHNIDPPPSKDSTQVYDRSGGPVSKDDAFSGFWKLDWNKSNAVVLTYTSKGDVFTFTDPRGVAHDRNCDGNDHPDSTAGAGDHYSCRFLDDRTYELTSKRNGKVVSTITRKISEDGKKMAQTVRNAEGKITSEYVFEKIL
jgi:hypothetical protein